MNPARIIEIREQHWDDPLPEWWADCPWPESVWQMTEAQYVAAVPDDKMRTAISGLLMRMGWNVAMKQARQMIQDDLLAALESESGKVASLENMAGWAQAILTALNVGDVRSGSALHLKLREIMIAHRKTINTEETNG
jgi:hypothetical protein